MSLKTFRDPSSRGFTLLELLVVVLIVGVLAAITAPGLMGWLNRQRISGANEQAFNAVRSAQAKAIANRIDYQASFRVDDGQAQVAVHSARVPIANVVNWENLPESIVISSTLTSEVVDGDTVYYARFNFKGNPYPPLGRVTFSSSLGGSAQRCVFISTLIGGLRTAQDDACL